MPVIPLLRDLSHFWSVLVQKGMIQSFSSYYLAGYFNFSAGEGKCQALLASQLGYEKEREILISDRYTH
jgi:hypothetical protein